MFEDAQGVCGIIDIVFSANGATNNQQVVAAVSGKIILVLSGNLRSSNAAASQQLTFKSASGGTNKRSYQVPASIAATPNVEIPWSPFGAFRTAVGEGLFCDNAGADPITISLTYIPYTP
jgi:hypothetical protein